MIGRKETLLLAGLTLLMSCQTTKFLKEEEIFLIENRIEFEKDFEYPKKGSLQYELSTLTKQQPNTNFFLIPREWFFYASQDTLDKSRFAKSIKRWQMRQFGEVPTLYNYDLAESAERQMEYYLQHKGFFQATVQSFPEYRNRSHTKVRVTYEVSPGRIYLIDSVQYLSRDTAIAALLQEARGETFLKKGSPMDERSYDQEVSRLTRYFRNHGYAYFTSSHFASLEADSNNHAIDLVMEVLLPPSDTIHRKYQVGKIFIYPQYNPAISEQYLTDSLGDSIYVQTVDRNFGVRARVLKNSVSLHPGQDYRQDDFDKTYQTFANLGVYRFVSIKETPAPDQPGVLDFHIYLSPKQRLEGGADLEVNTSNSPFIGRRLLGFSGSLSLRNRNLLRGAELLVANAEGGLDIDLSQFDNLDSLVNTIDLRLSGDVYFPKFVDYFGVWKGLSALHLVRRPFYQALRDKGTTRLALSYNNVRRLDLYTINAFNASFGYDFRPNNRARYLINHVGIDYLSPRTTILFDTLILDKNEFLRRSFDRQLFTGFLLRDISYTYTGLPNRFGESFSFIGQLELSGGEVFLANQLYNQIVRPDMRDTFRIQINEEDIFISQYARLDLDGRYFRRINNRQSVALRANIGLALPFGYSTSVPYVKQFFVGGPQSVRAWAAREIGPGGYLDPISADPDANPTLFYQTGDVKLEFNAEYRFQLITIFGVKYEGAIFLDAGNVYTLRDTSRLYSQLRWNPIYDENNQKIGDNFLKYMAVGSGFGLRVDLTYFVFRLDVGIKLRNPYPTFRTNPDGSVDEIHWRNLFPFQFRELNYNIGLGYPF